MIADTGHDDGDRPSITETKASLYEMMARGLRDARERLQEAARRLADSDRPPPTSEDEPVDPVSRPTPVH